jgi:hypothetical protein
MKQNLLYILILIQAHVALGQDGWVYKGNFNVGCNMTLNYSRGSTAFPGLKIFAGLGINGVYQNHFMLNYGPSLSIYTKSIGANLNPLASDIQIDFTNSLSVGAGTTDLSYYKLFRTLDNGSYYNVMLDKAYAILFTSNFIVNNHKRNQVVGAVSLSFPHFTINYFNDGGAPFYIIPIADNLDRYWTGGISVFVHNADNYKVNFNSVEASFDQFTGYSPLLFEACSMLGIYMPNYNLQYEEGTNAPKTANYNTSMYDIKFFPMKGYGIRYRGNGGIERQVVQANERVLLRIAGYSACKGRILTASE